MKSPATPYIEAIGAAFGFDGLKVRWPDGRVFVYREGKWRKI